MPKDQNTIMKDTLLFIGSQLGPDDDLYQGILEKYEKEWDKLAEQAESDKATKQEKDDAKRQMEALAKGLPAIATGLRDAIKGFQKGDAFAGSAAVMDICSSLSSTVGALSAVGGPIGAIIGALFSIVSMILKMFVKEQKSLTVQIEEIIRTIQSESKIQKLHAAQQALEAFLNTITSEGTKWNLDEYFALLNPIEGSTITTIRTSAEWLKEPKNQGLPLWGPVLAAQCDAYTNLMVGLTYAITSIDITQLPDKGEKNIAKLTAAFEGNNPIQLRFLEAIKPAAQSRGTIWTIGVFQSNNFDKETYPDSGYLYVRDSKTDPWKRLDKNYHRVITVSKTSNSSSPYPYLAIFGLEPIWDSIKYPPTAPYRKNYRAYGLFGEWPLSEHTEWQEVKELDGCYDIWATPGANEHEVYVYAAKGNKLNRYVHNGNNGKHSNDKGHKLRLRADFSVKFAIPAGETVGAVCAIAQPKSFADEDPGILEKEDWIVYGGGECEVVAGIGPITAVTAPLETGVFNPFEKRKVRVVRACFSSGLQGSFPTSSIEINGMRVDSKYLWVFDRASIACVTHTSIKQYLLNLIQEPSWMTYHVPDDLFDRTRTFDGLIDLSPCDDGTLVVVFSDTHGDEWTVVNKWNNNKIYYLTPRIDRTTKTFVVEGKKKDNYGNTIKTNGWIKEEEEDARAHRVLKQPIFCWSMIEH